MAADAEWRLLCFPVAIDPARLFYVKPQPATRPMRPMRAKTVIYGSGVVILCSASFWLGDVWRSRNVLTYEVDQIRVGFHTDWCTYGLPMTEYRTILAALRNGDTNTAIQKAECYLDLAVYDAKRRRPLLNGWRLEDFDKVLRATAQYREQYPRPKPAPAVESTVPGFAEWSARVEKANAEMEQEIDSFLRDALWRH